MADSSQAQIAEQQEENNDMLMTIKHTCYLYNTKSTYKMQGEKNKHSREINQ
jgi:hypothetical protein